MNIKLVEVSNKYLDDIWEYREELLDINDSFDGTSRLKDATSKEEFLNTCEVKENDPSGFVPNTLYLSIDENNNVVGMIDFRHHINHPILNDWGGHIGYNIRPKYRHNGLGTKQLALCLNKIKEFGLDKVLVTCRKNNEASRKIILANKGIYEKDTMDNKNNPIERYWITL